MPGPRLMQGNVRPIKPQEFAELAWRVLFLKGEQRRNPYASSTSNSYSWVYEDDVIHIGDFESRDYLTVRYALCSIMDPRVLLSKRGSFWECFVPEERAVAHLERLLVLDTLAGL